MEVAAAVLFGCFVEIACDSVTIYHGCACAYLGRGYVYDYVCCRVCGRRAFVAFVCVVVGVARSRVSVDIR